MATAMQHVVGLAADQRHVGSEDNNVPSFQANCIDNAGQDGLGMKSSLSILSFSPPGAWSKGGRQAAGSVERVVPEAAEPKRRQTCSCSQ